MYIVTIKNGTVSTEIQSEHHKLYSGSIVQGINTIDSFSFSVLPSNPAFGALNEFTTLVAVYNTAKGRYEFHGRVLRTTPSMSEDGLLIQEAICESYLGFLYDSQQNLVAEREWTVTSFLQYVINQHNSRIEPYKQFKLGLIQSAETFTCDIERKSTWETIQEKLIDNIGGEIRYRTEGNNIYIDYAEEHGAEKTTAIALSKNMKSITKEKDPSDIITQLIPVGYLAEEYKEDKEDKEDEEGEGDDAIYITEVNNGVNYISDYEAYEAYGIHEGTVEFKDVKDASDLLSQAQKWLKKNNKVLVKYTITALDLSLIGLDVNDFEVYNSYPVQNSLLGVDDKARISKKTIDVCDDTKSSFEIGDMFKTLSELQSEQNSLLGKTNATITEIKRNYATNVKVEKETKRLASLIEQAEERITLGVSQNYVSTTALGDYLKDYVTEERFNSISVKVDGIDLTAYAKTTEVNNKLTKYPTTDALTETLKSYATTERVSKIEVAVDKIDLSVYAKTEEVNETLSTYVKDGELTESLASYYTKTEVDNAIQLGVDGIDLSVYAKTSMLGYYTTLDEYRKKMADIDDTTDGLATDIQEVEGKLALTIEEDENGRLYSQLRADVDKIKFNSGEIEIRAGKTGMLSKGAVRFYSGAESETIGEIYTYDPDGTGEYTISVKFDTSTTYAEIEIPDCVYIYSATATYSYDGGGSAAVNILTPTPAYTNKIKYRYGGSGVTGTITFNIKYSTEMDAKFLVLEDGSLHAIRGAVGGWIIEDDCLSAVSSYTANDGNIYYQKTQLTPLGISVWSNTEGDFTGDPSKFSWHDIIYAIQYVYSRPW